MTYLRSSTTRKLDELKTRQAMLEEIVNDVEACQAAPGARVCECALEYLHCVSQRQTDELESRKTSLENACLKAFDNAENLPPSWAEYLLSEIVTLSLERACAAKQTTILNQLRETDSCTNEQHDASPLEQLCQLSLTTQMPGARAFLNNFIRRWREHPGRITVDDIDIVAELTGTSPASILDLTLQWSTVDRNALADSSSVRTA